VADAPSPARLEEAPATGVVIDPEPIPPTRDYRVLCLDATLIDLVLRYDGRCVAA
jgi:hypothetical protein